MTGRRLLTLGDRVLLELNRLQAERPGDTIRPSDCEPGADLDPLEVSLGLGQLRRAGLAKFTGDDDGINPARDHDDDPIELTRNGRRAADQLPSRR